MQLAGSSFAPGSVASFEVVVETTFELWLDPTDPETAFAFITN